jgi:hypothetical protein
MDDPNIYSDEEIPIYSEFETRPFDDEGKKFLEPFFIVQKSDLKRYGWINVRLTVHKLIDKLIKEGWIDVRYPRSVLDKEWEVLQDLNADRHMAPGQVFTYSREGHPGLVLCQHFLDWGGLDTKTVADGWSRPSTLYMAIQSLVGSRSNITRYNIIRHMRNPAFGAGRRVCGPRYVGPPFYYSIVKNFFKRHSSIYDHDPRFGSKLMAATLLDAEYVPNNPNPALYDMAKYVGCKISPEKDEYDLAILTSIDPLDADDAIALIDEYLPRCRGLAVIVNRDSLEYIANTFSPSRILEAHMYPLFLHEMGLHYLLIYQR